MDYPANDAKAVRKGRLQPDVLTLWHQKTIDIPIAFEVSGPRQWSPSV
jgi:hypothetical protein